MKKVLSLLLVASSILSMQLDLVNVDNKASKLSHYIASKINNKTHIKSPSVFVPDKLGSVELYHNKKGFYVKQDNEKHIIKKYFTDPIVRDITKKQLNAFLTNGYLSLNQMNDGEFSLKANGRLNGGGPILGKFMYWLTKSVCYGSLAAIATTSVVGVGGAVIGTISDKKTNNSNSGTYRTYDRSTSADIGETLVYVGAGLVGSKIVEIGTISTTGAVIGTSVGVVAAGTPGGIAMGATAMGAAAAAETATGAAITKAATVAAGSAVASGATPMGIVAGIEALSIAVGTFFGMAPTP